MGRMGKEFLLLLVTAAIAPASVVASAQDIAAIIDDCESCHGRGGASAWKDIPVIGGMSAFYLDAQLHAYQDGYRPCGEVEYPAGPERGLVGDMCEALDGLDATQIGNIARYINHCCTPNCYSKVITEPDADPYIPGSIRGHIVIFAARDLGEGEEVTYDYKFQVEAKKIACHCGSPKCLGVMN